MCTIFTIDKLTYDRMPKAVKRRQLADFRFNNDGSSLVFLDPDRPDTNTIFRTMSIGNLVANMGMLMAEASPNARVFIHHRSATTQHIGVGFTHGFDDTNGIVYMHNGVIDNSLDFTVDSFNLPYLGTGPDAIFAELLKRHEYFANIFHINTVLYEYSVIRLQSGSLHTDDRGNYSTQPVGTINRWVQPTSLTNEIIRQTIVSSYPIGSLHDASATTFTSHSFDSWAETDPVAETPPPYRYADESSVDVVDHIDRLDNQAWAGIDWDDYDRPAMPKAGKLTGLPVTKKVS